MGSSFSGMFDWQIVLSEHAPAGSMFYSTVSNQIFMNNSTFTASQQVAPAGKEPSMSQHKTFLVTFADEAKKPEYIDAHSVEEKGARLVFSEYANGATTVKKSFLGELVASYEVVPAQERPVAPKFTFRFELADGSSKTVDGDKVMHANGTEGGKGRYSVVTEVSPGNNRTELVVPEDAVKSVERVKESVSDSKG